MTVGARAQVAAIVDELARQLRMRVVRVERCKIGSIGEKFRDHVLVFLRLARTRRIDQTPSRANDFRSVPQHLYLRCGESGQILFMTPPSNIGIASERSETRARRIDNRGVKRSTERKRVERVCLNDGNVARTGRADGA